MAVFTDLLLKNLAEKGIRAEIAEHELSESGQFRYVMNFLNQGPPPYRKEVFKTEEQVFAATVAEWESLPETEKACFFPAKPSASNDTGKGVAFTLKDPQFASHKS